ncbi:MAG: N-acetyl-gamma-glutamyl-phosphate reductase [Nitrospirales bacterium]
MGALASERVRVAVVGASGYTGAELLRLLVGHPRVTLTIVTSEKSAGQPVASVFPHLTSILPLSFEALAPDSLPARADVVFLALPHTKAMPAAAVCLAMGLRVIDLSADFRLSDPALYAQWYETAHQQPGLLKEAVYGLPELHRDAIRNTRLVAAPGCYPTAAVLQLAPLVARHLVQADGLLIDAKSGVSGAGRSPALPYHFPEAHESVEAYKVGRHRHIPEIEQELTVLAARRSGGATAAGVRVLFIPHLVPMNRGILSTAYARLTQSLTQNDVASLYQDFYKGESFVRLQSSPSAISPRHVRGSNYCDIAIVADPRSNWVVTVAALDNLVKGAGGQAIQAMNLMLGFPENLGLTSPAVFP